MDLFFHILRYKVLSFLKTTFDFRFSTVIRGVGSLLVFGVFASGAYMLSFEVTKYVLEQPRIGLFLFHRFISMVLFVFFVSVNLGNIIVSYATLYRSPEVAYLLTKPVSYTKIFVLKFFDNFLYSSATLFLVALMVLVGYGTYFNYPWYGILGMLVFLLIPFMFLSACIAVLVLMALMKMAGRFGFRRVMGTLGTVYLILVYLFFRFSNPIKLVEEVGKFYPNVDLSLPHLDPFFAKYLPSHWLAEFLFFLSKGQIDRALPFAVLLLLATAGLFVICLLVADRFYYKSWLITFQVQAASSLPRSKGSLHWFDFRRSSFFPPQIESLLKKEYFQFFREPSQWIHLGLMVVLITVFVSSVRGLNFILRVPELPAFTYLTLYIFGGFLAASLALRFVFPVISLEGQSFWAILSTPISVKKVYYTKFILGLFLVLVLTVAIAYFSNLPFLRLTPRNRMLMWFGLYSAIWVSLAMTAINIGLGGYFANFQEKNPIRVASSQGATLSFLVTLVYLIVLVGIIILPISSHFDAIFANRLSNPANMIPPGIVFGVVSAFCVSAGMYVGLRSLRRDF